MDDRNDKECTELDDLIYRAEMDFASIRRGLDDLLRQEVGASARLAALQDAKAAIIRARKKAVTP